MWSRGREQGVKRQQVIPTFAQEAVKRWSNQKPVIPPTILTVSPVGRLRFLSHLQFRQFLKSLLRIAGEFVVASPGAHEVLPSLPSPCLEKQWKVSKAYCANCHLSLLSLTSIRPIIL